MKKLILSTSLLLLSGNLLAASGTSQTQSQNTISTSTAATTQIKGISGIRGNNANLSDNPVSKNAPHSGNSASTPIVGQQSHTGSDSINQTIPKATGTKTVTGTRVGTTPSTQLPQTQTQHPSSHQ